MIGRILNNLGYSPLLANNGKEIIDILEKDTFDLVLMDVQMPQIDGLEATRLIRKHYGDRPFVIAMTANVLIEDKEGCLNAGMDDYISKPIRLTALISVLERYSSRIKHIKGGMGK